MENLVDGFIGTYASEQSEGIYHFLFNIESGQMTDPELFYKADNAKWVCLDGSSMTFPVEKQGRAGTCFLELQNGEVTCSREILEETQTPCYILQEGAYVYTANYHEGTVMVYHLKDGIQTLVKRIENGAKAGCHQILLHRGYLMVPCLEQNRIRLFDITRDFIPAGEILFPEGSGPRHGVFNREHTKFYVVSEWSNELFVFRVYGREFVLSETLSILNKSGGAGIKAGDAGREDEAEKSEEKTEKKPEKTGIKKASKDAAAAIRITEDGRFLYVSVRGADILAVFEIREDGPCVIQVIPCGGVHPRDFILSENEKFLLAANRYAGGIVCFERDKNTGLLKNTGLHIDMPEAVALVLAKPDAVRTSESI